MDVIDNQSYHGVGQEGDNPSFKPLMTKITDILMLPQETLRLNVYIGSVLIEQTTCI